MRRRVLALYPSLLLFSLACLFGCAGDSLGDLGCDDGLCDEPTAEELLAPPYLMWMTEEAVTVRWETSTPVMGRVDYGLDAGLGMTARESEATTVHEIRLEGLSASTAHHYRISWDDKALPAKTFTTGPGESGGDAFNFVVWGDNQNGPETFTEIVPRMAAEEPSFGLSSGDCVEVASREAYRNELFAPLSSMADHVPFMVAAGNHERYGEAGLFDEYMSLPGDEHCYSWQWGSLFVVFIDTELPLDEESVQHACVVDALTSDDAIAATFRAAIFHIPPRIEWWFGGKLAFTNAMERPPVRLTLAPLLESLGVDIVFNGHNHLLAHTPKTAGGTTWITSGGGGGTLDSDSSLWRIAEWPEIETTLHEHHFLSVSVDGAEMAVKAINVEGEEIHSFTVKAKGPCDSDPESRCQAREELVLNGDGRLSR